LIPPPLEAKLFIGHSATVDSKHSLRKRLTVYIFANTVEHLKELVFDYGVQVRETGVIKLIFSILKLELEVIHNPFVTMETILAMIRPCLECLDRDEVFSKF
jgi:hypothetical protein